MQEPETLLRKKAENHLWITNERRDLSDITLGATTCQPWLCVCFFFTEHKKKIKRDEKNVSAHINTICCICLPFTLFSVWHYSRNQEQLVEPTSKSTWLINPDFLPCPVLYVVVVITIIQQLQALSVKAWCSFPSIRLQRLRAFPPYRVWPFFFFCVWKCLWA